MTSSRYTTSTKPKPKHSPGVSQNISDSEWPSNLKEWYRNHADDTSVSYKEFLKRLRRMGSPRSGINKRLVREGRLPPPPKRESHNYKITPFLAYDGEGRGKDGVYNLLANRFEEIYNPEGLSSKECLDFLCRRYPNSYIRIAYGFGYDVNMILKDMPLEYWEHITSGVRWAGHRIQYLPGKMFRVDGFTYYDILPFFARGLIAAMKDVLHKEDPVISEGKSLRADLFDALPLEKIREYNQHELIYTEELAEHLREALEHIGLHLTAWYGPGAIAKKMFQVNQVQQQFGVETPPDCYFALENAYYGGRFENDSLGKETNVWEYDIHSAYPAILAKLPYFRDWKHVRQFQPDQKFALWHVTFDFRSAPTNRLLQPFPFRSRDGRLSFPLVGKGWYWAPELSAAIKYYGAEYIKITEGWIAETEGQPFEWVEKLYYQRMELKDAGDASEYAIKVGINSLYGKTAQRVGRAAYFNIAWAGYITSATRAKLLEAYSISPEECIGFATDAIYSRGPIRGLQVSNRLGDWEEKHYPSGGVFILPGLYVLSDGKIQKNRIRGLPSTDALVRLLDNLTERPWDLPKTLLRRFISNRLAYRAPDKYGRFRCQFVDVEYRLGVHEPRKRIYEFPRDPNHASKDNPLGIKFGEITQSSIHSAPVIWGVDRIRTTEGEVRLTEEILFNKEAYELLLHIPCDIPASVSRQFTDDDDAGQTSLIEQEGEYIADLEPEHIADTIPVVEADVMEF